MTRSSTDVAPTPSRTADATTFAQNPAEIVRRLQTAEQAIQDALASYTRDEPSGAATDAIELSVVMPCLNEADTLAVCIEKAQAAMQEHQIVGEVIVADNGSTDGSIEIALRLGARVVQVSDRGYGNALRGGIAAAKGKYVLMGDADDSYDFLEIPKFVEQLRAGCDLVQGCRLPSGGGNVMPGAMPVTHRWIGNPMFSTLVRRMFRAPIHDVYCGLRGFTRAHYDRLDLQASGMEFATEMIIKSSLFDANMVEVPTTLHPDGRKAHAPHLRTVRDGWRTLRFFLMYSPRWLFLIPGLGLLLLGMAGYGLAMPGVALFGASLDAHTLLVASLCLLLGSQLVQFAVFAKTYAVAQRMVPPDRRLERFCEVLNLERCLVLGGVAFLLGIGLIAGAAGTWQAARFGPLDYGSTMRWVIPGVTLAALGFQAAFASFFISILRLKRPE